MISMPQHFLYATLFMVMAVLNGCDKNKIPTHTSVNLAGHTYSMELKLDTHGRQTGMMHRKSLGKREGMLFVFPQSEVLSFWMKNCLIDLDVIYLDATGRIVQILTMEVPEPNAPLIDYSSVWPAQFAIEINAGQAKELGLKNGQKIDLDLDRLKALAK